MNINCFQHKNSPTCLAVIFFNQHIGDSKPALVTFNLKVNVSFNEVNFCLDIYFFMRNSLQEIVS